ncbi:MAG: hypothetical protein AAF721_00545 [Myxococcota bacterium]
MPLAIGCGTKDPGEQKVETAVSIGRAIDKAPDNVEEILKKHKMTKQEYQALVFEITADKRLNELYQQGLGH